MVAGEVQSVDRRSLKALADRFDEPARTSTLELDDSLLALRAETLREPSRRDRSRHDPQGWWWFFTIPAILAVVIGAMEAEGVGVTAIIRWHKEVFWSLRDPYLLGGVVVAGSVVLFALLWLIGHFD